MQPNLIQNWDISRATETTGFRNPNFYRVRLYSSVTTLGVKGGTKFYMVKLHKSSALKPVHIGQISGVMLGGYTFSPLG